MHTVGVPYNVHNCDINDTKSKSSFRQYSIINTYEQINQNYIYTTLEAQCTIRH